MKIVALDCETYRIGPGAVAPKVVCVSLAMRLGKGELSSYLVANGDPTDIPTCLELALKDPAFKLVTHNGGFDYACIMGSYPGLIPLIFQALEQGRCTDTLWREKLLNLSSTGRLEQVALPDGSSAKIRYDLAGLELQYLQRDRTAEKNDEEEGWRVNFSALDGWKSADYPEDAAQYALQDAEGTLLVYEQQEWRKEHWPMSSTTTEEFQLASSLALYLMSAWGMAVDADAVAVMAKEVAARMEKNEALLIEHGILRPPVPAAPYKTQLEKVIRLLEVSGMRDLQSRLETWEAHQKQLEEQGIKFTAGKPASVDTKALQAYAAALFQRLGKIPTMTDSGTRIQLDAEVQDMLAAHDPVMAQYQARQSLSKLVGQQIPLLQSAEVVYPRYDALKETGRTSSYGNPKGKSGLYPAVHIQGVPKEIDGIDPRQCYVPRPGRVFFDCDYTALELACVGQTTYDLFGESVHLQRYNEGVDLHGYLGAQLVVMAPTEGVAREFTEACRAEGILSDPAAVYSAFMECKAHEDKAVREFFVRNRTFAKPVGLGFPGGLGPETMVEYARKQYGVTILEEQAREFREMWHEVYPEMRQYFEWINGQTDEYNSAEDGKALYFYETPLGMVRRGATYSAAANGKCMQSPGAEGAKTALIRLQRACYDPTQESVLFGCRPIAFIHDQIIGETTEDESLWHDQCLAVRDIMCRSMELILPDVKVRSDESHLTSVWSKKSVPVFDGAGRLIPWIPS